MTEIRSYRRVFDLERRIYSIERFRLNPAGVPVRGVVYLLGTLTLSLLAGRVPVLGAPFRALPWFLGDAGIPLALAAGLATIRIDGRRFHHAARSALSFWSGPRRVVALNGRSRGRRRWRPDDVLFIADGSEAVMRRFCYTGPGAVLVLVAHLCEPARSPLRTGRSAGPSTRIAARAPAARLARARVIELDRQTRVYVRKGRSAGRT